MIVCNRSLPAIRKHFAAKGRFLRFSPDTGLTATGHEADQRESVWVTLSSVDLVVAVSVDDRDIPRFALVQLLVGTTCARASIAHMRNVRRLVTRYRWGMWASLYFTESNDPVTHASAGAGLPSPTIPHVPLEGLEPEAAAEADDDSDEGADERLPFPKLSAISH